MKLYFYQDLTGSNFGDDLNPWLWPHLLGEVLDDDASELLVGIGTILDRRIPAAPRKVVFGSGIGYGRMPRLDETWRIVCVRGPLTAAALGLPGDLAITDPALLVRDVVPPSLGKVHQASFIPHHKTETALARGGRNLRAICAEIGVNYIDPGDDIEAILGTIRDSEVIVAEAMHGAIVADAFRVPWIPIQLSGQINSFKWTDWCRSLDMDYEPHVLDPDFSDAPERRFTSFLRDLLADALRQLSAELVTRTMAARLQERVHRLREDYAHQPRDNGAGQAHGMSAEFSGTPNLEVLRVDPALYDLHVVAEQIESLARLGSSLILMDQDWIRGVLDDECRAIPFLERDGQYWGAPPDDKTAIRELERLRRADARFLVVLWPAFWWLAHYADFGQYLESRYPCILRNERMVVFDLHFERTAS